MSKDKRVTLESSHIVIVDLLNWLNLLLNCTYNNVKDMSCFDQSQQISLTNDWLLYDRLMSHHSKYSCIN